jgi:hypothetical protein
VEAYSEVAEIEQRFTTTMVFSKRIIWTQDTTFSPTMESGYFEDYGHENGKESDLRWTRREE